MKLLILESSTTSAKAMLYDTESDKWRIATKPYGFTQDSNGTHDGEAVFLKTVQAAKEIADGIQVDIILQSTTWHSLALADKTGALLSPVELWSYTGANELCKRLRENGFEKNYYRKTGCLINSTYPYFKLMHKKENGMLLSNTKIGGQGEYDTYRLTGAWVTTLSMASGTGLLNIDSRTYDAELLSSLDMDESVLPEIVATEKTFPLSKEGARLLGQKEGTPVVPAYPDGALNQIGAGALKEGIMTFSVGTSAAIRMTTERPLLPETPTLWSYFTLSSHLLGAAVSGACNCQDWCKKTFFPNDAHYADIEKELSHTNDTPVFLPFLFGERCPGWNEKRHGGFLSVKPEHTVYNLYQSVLEGVLFSVYHCYEILADTAGYPKLIKLSGGILRSEFWMQICASLFDIPMTIDESEQSSVMGCAVIGLYLLGKIDSPISFQPQVRHVVKPDPALTDIYRKKYRAYRECYRNY